MSIKNIGIIGSGNLAWHLTKCLKQKEFVITVYSRTLENAQKLAKEFSCNAVSEINELPGENSIWIICVSDNEIKAVASQLPQSGPLCVHAAGSVSIDVFPKYLNNYGVFYPLQTFTKGAEIDFSEIPIFIEASNSKSLIEIERFANKLSKKVVEADTDQRKLLHLAAVIAGNFSNHMYTIAHELLTSEGLNFNYLKPLLQTTLKKIFDLSPSEAQTGPATRGNFNVINEHLRILKDNPQAQKIYSLISESIFKTSKIRK